MELSRRDAVMALLASGIGLGAAGTTAQDLASTDGDRRLSTSDARTLVAVAEVVYPSQVTVTEEFIQTYVLGKAEDRDGHLQGTLKAIDDLEKFSNHRFSTSFAEAEQAERDAILRKIGADEVTSAPSGTVPQRIRYYLVTDLLYALYTTPAGGQLIGNDNPMGHPGGLTAYQRGP